eukprot:Amastigsp_a349903_14.p4 type:complete len:108 gc:universal Amastigsp_a349903_14:446-123(-)
MLSLVSSVSSRRRVEYGTSENSAAALSLAASFSFRIASVMCAVTSAVIRVWSCGAWYSCWMRKTHSACVSESAMRSWNKSVSSVSGILGFSMRSIESRSWFAVRLMA